MQTSHPYKPRLYLNIICWACLFYSLFCPTGCSSFSKNQPSNLNKPYKEAVDISLDFWTGTFDVSDLRCRAKNGADRSSRVRLEETSSCALCNTEFLYSRQTVVQEDYSLNQGSDVTCKRDNDVKWMVECHIIGVIGVKKGLRQSDYFI